MLSDRCLSCPVLSVLSVCLSVTLVYCVQTVEWIKMPLGMEAGLGPGHIVLDGDPAPRPGNGAQPPIIAPCLLWPNGLMDQDATWHGGRPRPRQRVRWDPAPPIERSTTVPQHFLAHVYCGQKVAHPQLLNSYMFIMSSH